MPSSPRLLVLVATTIVAIASAPTGSFAAYCTTAETRRFAETHLRAPEKCEIQSAFEVCDDDCASAAEELVAAAANCSDGALTLREIAITTLDRCRAGRANATNKYMPQPSVGLENCTYEDQFAWNAKFGFGTAAGDCVKVSCSETCLKVLEESVTKAPACATAGDYWYGETKKLPLWSCVLALGRNPGENEVLQAVLHGNGTMTRNWATVSTSAPPATGRVASPGGTPSPSLASDASPKVPTSAARRPEAGAAVSLFMVAGVLTARW